MKKILVINPGSTSTKFAVFHDDKPVFQKTLRHQGEELAPYPTVASQYEFRKETILKALREEGIAENFDIIVGRGGLLKPIASGVYEVNEAMRETLLAAKYGEHASNLGGLVAADIAKTVGCKAVIADPVVVDELQDVARISGHPLLPNISIFHALNQKAIARRYAKECGKKYEEMNSLQIDALREIGSIGTGNAATSLSSLLGIEVRIPLPEVQILEFNAAVEKLGGFETIAAGIISDLRGEINGLMLALFQLDAINLLLGRTMGKQIKDYDELTEIENSAVIEIGNILISSFINALSGLSGVRITPSVPQLSIDMQGAIITVPMAAYGNQSDYIMLIGGSFLVEGKEVPCRLLLAPDMRSLNYLLNKLGICE